MAGYETQLLQICENDDHAVGTIVEFIKEFGTIATAQKNLASVPFNKKNVGALNGQKFSLFTLDELSSFKHNVCLMVGAELLKSTDSASKNKSAILYYDLKELVDHNFDISLVNTKTTRSKCYRLIMKSMLCFVSLLGFTNTFLTFFYVSRRR